MRLRPDGAKGLLVSSLASFADYQRQRAWTWEHQALVRARRSPAMPALCAAFDALARQKRWHARAIRRRCARTSSAMRRRMRAELDRSDAARFDLKQGEGGLVDLEFLLQERVLRAGGDPSAIVPTRRRRQRCWRRWKRAGEFAAAEAQALRAAHATLLARGLECTLDRRPRLCLPDAGIEAARAAVLASARQRGLDFSPD